MRLTDDQHADLTRSFVWTVEDGGWAGARVVLLGAMWKERPLKRVYLIDMGQIARLPFPEASLETYLLALQDEMIEFVERNG